MEFRRNGMRDERRRRVLIDETLHGEDAARGADDSSPTHRIRAKAYSDAALVANHAPITACIPKRPLSLWCLFLAGLCAIAAIEAAYAKLFLVVPPEMQGSLVALDVLARGSLASWFASVVLCCGAFASALVYLMRRHRTDDYRGRYRWWLWLVPLLLVLSMNAGTSLHQVLSGLLTKLSGAEVAVGGKGWWLLAYAAAFLPIVLQLAIELWPSRLATSFFVGTVASYLFVGAFELQAVECATPLATTVCHSALLLAAHFGVLLTVLSFGRFVYLDAHDAIPERKPWRMRLQLPKMPTLPRFRTATEQPVDESAEAPLRKATRVRVDAGHSLPCADSFERVQPSGKPLNQRRAGEKFGQENLPAPNVNLTVSNEAEESEAGDEPDEGRSPKLSKAERRKLRRESASHSRGG